jgi:hypothetical protein
VRPLPGASKETLQGMAGRSSTMAHLACLDCRDSIVPADTRLLNYRRPSYDRSIGARVKKQEYSNASNSPPAFVGQTRGQGSSELSLMASLSQRPRSGWKLLGPARSLKKATSAFPPELFQASHRREQQGGEKVEGRCFHSGAPPLLMRRRFDFTRAVASALAARTSSSRKVVIHSSWSRERMKSQLK